MCPDHWQEKRLGDLIEIKHGWPFKGDLCSEELTGRPVVVNIGNFRYSGGFRFESTRVREYLGDYPAEYELRPGEILLVMTCQTAGGEILGLPARVPRDDRIYLHNQRLGKVVIREQGSLNEQFLYWVFKWPQFNLELFKTASGTKILHTSPGRILRFNLALPPINEQQSIAKILGALDDKIELNRAMNQNLDAMAQAIFKSWFVDFDPVVANSEGRKPFGMSDEIAALFPDRFVESEFGPIPERWAVGTLANLVTVVMGQSPPGDSYNSVALGTPLVNGPAEFGEYFPAQIKWTTLPTKLSEKYDLMLCVRGSTTGRRVKSNGNYCLGRGVCAIRASGDWQSFVDCLIENEMANLLALTTGSTFPNLSRRSIETLGVVLPPVAALKAFERMTQGSFQMTANSHEQSSTLAELRDLLLPKLLSGEIRVKQAEKAVEEVL